MESHATINHLKLNKNTQKWIKVQNVYNNNNSNKIIMKALIKNKI